MTAILAKRLVKPWSLDSSFKIAAEALRVVRAGAEPDRAQRLVLAETYGVAPELVAKSFAWARVWASAEYGWVRVVLGEGALWKKVRTEKVDTKYDALWWLHNEIIKHGLRSIDTMTSNFNVVPVSLSRGAEPCALHEVYVKIRMRPKDVLAPVSIQMDGRKTFLLGRYIPPLRIVCATLERSESWDLS